MGSFEACTLQSFLFTFQSLIQRSPLYASSPSLQVSVSTPYSGPPKLFDLFLTTRPGGSACVKSKPTKILRADSLHRDYNSQPVSASEMPPLLPLGAPHPLWSPECLPASHPRLLRLWLSHSAPPNTMHSCKGCPS